MVWGAEDRDLRIGGCPDVGVGGAEEEEAGAVGGGGEVGDAGIVADEEGGAGEDGGEEGEFEVFGEEAGWLRGEGGEGEELGVIGFTADEEDPWLVVEGKEPEEEDFPVFEWPIFQRAAASWMDSDEWSGGVAEEGFGEGVIGGGGVEEWGGVIEEKGKALEGFGELEGDVFGGVGAGVSWEEVFDTCASEIGFEEEIGVEEVADDLVEAGEVVDEIWGEGGVGDEESREGGVFDGAGGIGVESSLGEGGDVGVAEDFEVGGGEVFSEESDRGEGEDEIADGTAPDDENAGLHGVGCGIERRAFCWRIEGWRMELLAIGGEATERALAFPFFWAIPRDGADLIGIG